MSEQTVSLILSELTTPQTFKTGDLILKQDRRSNLCAAQSPYFVNKCILCHTNCEEETGASAFSRELIQLSKNVKQYMQNKS
jgi:hypothetical protein